MEYHDKKQLEEMVEHYGLISVLNELANICDHEAERKKPQASKRRYAEAQVILSEEE